MKDIKYADTAIVICTYKNRFDYMLKHIQNFADTFPVYVVMRKDDKYESGYDKYEELWQGKVKEILLEDVTNIMETREKARQEILKRGHRALIFLDDDIYGDFALINLPGNQKPGKWRYYATAIPFIRLLTDLVDKSNEHDASYASCDLHMFLGFRHPGEISKNRTLNTGCVVFLNLEDLEEKNIRYTTTELHEDVDIMIQILTSGLTGISLRDHSFKMIPYNAETSIVGNEDWLRIGTYLKWKGFVDLAAPYSKCAKTHTLKIKISYAALSKNTPKPYDKELYELCEREFYGGRDIQKIMDYLVKKLNKN